MAVGCPFITCALKKKGVEFCWKCKESQSCDKWKHHREFSQQFDTFKCYRKLEDNISFVQENGVVAFEKNQQAREELLEQMLAGFNEGRSKSYYCIAATVLETRELEEALDEARAAACGLGMKEKARILHTLLDAVAKRRNLVLKLRKYVGSGTMTTIQEE